MEYRIIEGKAMHKGKELDTYIPQYSLEGEIWYDLLSKGSYILKVGCDALDRCNKCDGKGCKECRNIGLRAIVPAPDLKYYAELIINAHKERYNL